MVLLIHMNTGSIIFPVSWVEPSIFGIPETRLEKGKATRVGKPSIPWAFDKKLIKPYFPAKGFYATDAFTDWGLEWLGEKERADDPFFLYLAYNAPHWPLHAHPDDIAKYKGVYDSGYEAIRKARYERQLAIGLFDEAVTPLSEPEHKPWTTLSPKERDEEALRMQIHAAMVDRLDQNIGRLLGKLRELGQLENTLIIFLVDNGASHERPKRGEERPRCYMGKRGFL